MKMLYFYLRARGISKRTGHCCMLLRMMRCKILILEPLKLKISKLLAEKLEVEIAFEDLD